MERDVELWSDSFLKGFPVYDESCDSVPNLRFEKKPRIEDSDSDSDSVNFKKRIRIRIRIRCF